MTRDPIRDAILGDGETRIDSHDAAERVRAYLLSDEAVERAAEALHEHDEEANDRNEREMDIDLGGRETWAAMNAKWPEIADAFRSRARAAILAAMGGKTDE